jgi:CheY-like chemotaxis protein
VLSPADNLANTEIDPNQIEQVVMNLAVNARDAMPKGGTITIETANVVLDENYANRHIGTKPGHYVMLSISDTGTGMDKETQGRIFEPFFTTKEQGKGTGLGLATVYGIVKQSGGDIWVYSEPGQGTTFKIYLPRAEKATETIWKTEAPVKLLNGTETILIVEDEGEVRKVARRILHRYGYAAMEAANGSEALSLCEQHKGKIQLVLTDTVMPGINGLELAVRLAASYPSIRVIFMSGYTDVAIVQNGILKSEIHFIEKPFTPEKLLQKVRAALDSN